MASVKVKGILWGLLFGFTGFIYLSIPTKLIFTYWLWLNAIVDFEGNAIYTYALFAVFGYVVAEIVAFVYFTAMVRAFAQSNKPVDTPSYGISYGVKKVAIITSLLFIILMVTWYIIFQQIAIYSLDFPPIPD